MCEVKIWGVWAPEKGTVAARLGIERRNHEDGRGQYRAGNGAWARRLTSDLDAKAGVTVWLLSTGEVLSHEKSDLEACRRIMVRFVEIASGAAVEPPKEAT